MSKLIITCKEASKLLCEKEEARLDRKRRFLLWVHLKLCVFCKRFQKQSQLLDTLVRSMEQHTSHHCLSHTDKAAIVASLESPPAN